VNITDIDPETLPVVEGDMLEIMFKSQWEGEMKYRAVEGKNGYFPDIKPDYPLDIHQPDVQWLLKDASQRIIEELCEATNLLKNKQWKNTQVKVDVEHFNEEMADAFKFFLRLLAIIWGEHAPRILFEMYRRKTTVTDFRLDTNY